MCRLDVVFPAGDATKVRIDDAFIAAIGVNSRVFFRDRTRSGYGASLVSSTGTPEFTAWATQWAKNTQAAVCGLAGTPDKCRT